MQMNICLRDLPTRKKLHCLRAPTKISGQQPTQLYKEFPRVHGVGHSKKKVLAWKKHVRAVEYASC